MKVAAILGSIFGIIFVIGTVLFMSYISAYNTGNRMEQTIKATYQNNENILAQYGQKVIEAAQVTELQRDDLTQVVEAAIQGRYGADGSKAVFQMITEQNPTLDSTVYVQLQRIIEAGRNEFQQNQTIFLDQKRIYETALGSFWQGMWMGVAGYPKINLAEYTIISTERASDAFKTKKEEAIKLR